MKLMRELRNYIILVIVTVIISTMINMIVNALLDVSEENEPPKTYVITHLDGERVCLYVNLDNDKLYYDESLTDSFPNHDDKPWTWSHATGPYYMPFYNEVEETTTK